MTSAPSSTRMASRSAPDITARSRSCNVSVFRQPRARPFISTTQWPKSTRWWRASTRSGKYSAEPHSIEPDMDSKNLYQEVILDHNKKPRNWGKLADASHQAEGLNPLCGDHIWLSLKLDGDKVGSIAFEGESCAICKASSSMMTKIADLEYTPNPNARKFVLKEPLTNGLARSFENAEQAQRDALATKLFAIPHVSNVFYIDNWITVTQDGEADWQNLLREVATPIREAPAAEKASEEFAKAAAWLAEEEGGGATMSESDKLKLEQINELLDEEVRPFLQGDGGDLYVVGLEGSTLKVHYQGACGTCPSSISGTLAGIEGLVKRIDPEMEVVAV